MSERTYIDPMSANDWENLLALAFSSTGKTSMKADKAIKRAVKAAALVPPIEGTSKKEMKKQLKYLLSRYDDRFKCCPFVKSSVYYIHVNRIVRIFFQRQYIRIYIR